MENSGRTVNSHGSRDVFQRFPKCHRENFLIGVGSSVIVSKRRSATISLAVAF
jgi:hypothetical protein